MYLPAHYAETRPDVLRALIERHPFATLVSSGPDGLVADHLPMLLHPRGDGFVLHGHVARPNPVWRQAAGQDVLALFNGPDTYVTPSWYATKQETGEVVPTWNYIVVHIRGRLHAIEDLDWLRAHVGQLTTEREAPRSVPWRVTDAPAEYVERMLAGIVGLEVEIRELVGKRKASQTRPPQDIEGVIAGLRENGDPFVDEMPKG